MATVIIQKSTREGFGLTVTEGMWKGKPVIGGDVGGIRLQVVNHHTGFLVNTPEGAALRIRYLLHHQDGIDRMERSHGVRAGEFPAHEAYPGIPDAHAGHSSPHARERRRGVTPGNQFSPAPTGPISRRLK